MSEPKEFNYNIRNNAFDNIHIARNENKIVWMGCNVHWFTLDEARVLAHKILDLIGDECEDPVVEGVRKDLLDRSKLGILKYGTNLAREDLTLFDWLKHAYEEQLDNANYLKRALLDAQRMMDDGR